PTGAVSTSCAVILAADAIRLFHVTAVQACDLPLDGSSGTTGVTASKHSTATGLVCDPSVPVGSAASCTATVTDTVATAPFPTGLDRKSTRLNSSHVKISYAVCCLKKKSCSVSYTSS